MSSIIRIYSILLFFNSFLNAQPTKDNIIDKEPEKCYVRALTNDTFEAVDSLIIPIYSGSDFDQAFVRKKEIVICEAANIWSSRKTNQNCISDNPDDCLVRCLVEIPAEKIVKYIVIDTSLTKDYYWEFVSIKKLVKKISFEDWYEVICDYTLIPDFNINIQKALINKGYHSSPLNRDIKISKTTFIDLIKFQKENNLPIGNLNIKTMNALGIVF